jgi:hypothetical protein
MDRQVEADDPKQPHQNHRASGERFNPVYAAANSHRKAERAIQAVLTAYLKAHANGRLGGRPRRTATMARRAKLAR